jgi:hypothetical protein
VPELNPGVEFLFLEFQEGIGEFLSLYIGHQGLLSPPDGDKKHRQGYDAHKDDKPYGQGNEETQMVSHISFNRIQIDVQFMPVPKTHDKL